MIVSINLGRILKPFIGVSPKKALSFSEGNTPAWKQLEAGVLAAIEGYHATLDDARLEVLVPRLDTIPLDVRGYAYEGAAMGLTGLDFMTPWKKRLPAYVAGPGSAHIYMVHIGIGEALGLMQQKPEPFMERLDPVLRWLVMDGYGFHKAFFSKKRYLYGQEIPGFLSPYAKRIFTQGVGRAIWFLNGANIDRVVKEIAKFPESRHADLWCGIGVGCAYGGGVERSEIERLQRLAGKYAPHLGLGAGVVARGRVRAGNPTAHSDLACEVLCGVPTSEASRMVEQAFVDLPPNGAKQAFEVLQERMLAAFAETGARQPEEALK